MRHLPGSMLALGASALLSGCLATQSQLKHSSDNQARNLAEERRQRIEADSALAQELHMVRGDVKQLRADLEAMRQDFGAKITAMEDGMRFAMPVNFAFDDANVRPQDRQQLDRFARVAKTYYPGSKITIAGFADPAGSARYNLALSARRAQNVRSYLQGAAGLNTNELAVVGFGEAQPVAPGASRDEPGAELNRRVVFMIESRPTGRNVASVAHGN